MNATEAMQELIDRYDCEVYQSPWGVHIYHGDFHALISFEEKIQKWGNGTIWNKSQQIWSTGEFAERRKYSTIELLNIFDQYFPKRTEISLF